MRGCVISAPQGCYGTPLPSVYENIKCVYGAPGGRRAVRNTVSSAGGARRSVGVELVSGAPGGCGSVVSTARIATSSTQLLYHGPVPYGHSHTYVCQSPRLASPRLDTVLRTAPHPPGAPIGENLWASVAFEHSASRYDKIRECHCTVLSIPNQLGLILKAPNREELTPFQ